MHTSSQRWMLLCLTVSLQLSFWHLKQVILQKFGIISIWEGEEINLKMFLKITSIII